MKKEVLKLVSILVILLFIGSYSYHYREEIKNEKASGHLQDVENRKY